LLKSHLLFIDLLGAVGYAGAVAQSGTSAGECAWRGFGNRGFQAAPYNVFHFHESPPAGTGRGVLEGFSWRVKVDAYGVITARTWAATGDHRQLLLATPSQVRRAIVTPKAGGQALRSSTVV